ncbi:MAG: hypothetical protein FJ272_13565 [Planctomycetes bacterium]|nr:hypothetical protein [Planctomycetota bacterium]
MSISGSDKAVLRELGKQIAEIAALPIQQKRQENHAAINRLERAKPTILIYQVPWHEMDVDGELTLRTQDPFCQGIELNLRRTLYSWKHMPGDMVVGATISSPPAIRDTGFGIREQVDIARTDPKSDVVSRHFHIQIRSEDDLEKIKMPVVTHDPEATERLYQMRCEIFDGVLTVRKCGTGSFWFAPWDEIVRWTGVDEVLMDMVMRPAYVHKIIDRMVTAWLCRLDQYVAQGLLSGPPSELWGVGAAQIFSAVSPAMHEEFALRHEARWFERWGKNYYGCCEPLDLKVDVIRKNIPRLRKISMSPWVDFDRAVQNVGDSLIFAWKPNPAVLATETWHPDAVRKDMEEKLRKARGCVVEIHMKDISTVRYEPQRLWDWARIAGEVTGECGGE